MGFQQLSELGSRAELLALLQRQAVSGACCSASCSHQSLARSCQLSAGLHFRLAHLQWQL